MKAFLQVSRWPLTLLGWIACIAILSWTGQLFDYPRSVLIILAIGLGNWGMNILNECMDLKSDKLKNPLKPLPSGKIDWGNTITISGIMILASLIFSSLLVWYDPFYLIAYLGLASGYVYNVLRKDIIGNFFNSGAYSIAHIVSLYPYDMKLALAFFFYSFSFNFAVQWKDQEYDRRAGVLTAPQQLGDILTSSIGFFLSLMALSLYAVLWREFNSLAFVFMFFSAFCCFLSSIVISTNASKLVKKTFIEYTNRKIGRILLLIGYLWLFFY